MTNQNGMVDQFGPFRRLPWLGCKGPGSRGVPFMTAVYVIYCVRRLVLSYWPLCCPVLELG